MQAHVHLLSPSQPSPTSTSRDVTTHAVAPKKFVRPPKKRKEARRQPEEVDLPGWEQRGPNLPQEGGTPPQSSIFPRPGPRPWQQVKAGREPPSPATPSTFELLFGDLGQPLRGAPAAAQPHPIPRKGQQPSYAHVPASQGSPEQQALRQLEQPQPYFKARTSSGGNFMEPDEAWASAFLLTNAQRRRAVERRRNALYGRRWRQLDLRAYLLRRARHAHAYAQLGRAAGDQMRAAQREAITAAAPPALLYLSPPSEQQQQQRQGSMAQPQIRLPRQRGDVAFDDSLPKPQTFFKLPMRWRTRLLWERVALLRASMPSLSPRRCAELYRGAPLLLCFKSAAVAKRLHALALLLRCSYEDVAHKVAFNPALAVLSCEALESHATLLSSAVTAEGSSGMRRGGDPLPPGWLDCVGVGAGGTDLSPPGVARAIASRSGLLMAFKVSDILRRCEELAVALGVSMRASLRMLLMSPPLMQLGMQQALDMAQLMGVLQQQPLGRLALGEGAAGSQASLPAFALGRGMLPEQQQQQQQQLQQASLDSGHATESTQAQRAVQPQPQQLQQQQQGPWLLSLPGPQRQQQQAHAAAAQPPSPPAAVNTGYNDLQGRSVPGAVPATLQAGPSSRMLGVAEEGPAHVPAVLEAQPSLLTVPPRTLADQVAHISCLLRVSPAAALRLLGAMPPAALRRPAPQVTASFQYLVHILSGGLSQASTPAHAMQPEAQAAATASGAAQQQQQQQRQSLPQALRGSSIPTMADDPWCEPAAPGARGAHAARQAVLHAPLLLAARASELELAHRLLLQSFCADVGVMLACLDSASRCAGPLGGQLPSASAREEGVGTAAATAEVAAILQQLADSYSIEGGGQTTASSRRGARNKSSRSSSSSSSSLHSSLEERVAGVVHGLVADCVAKEPRLLQEVVLIMQGVRGAGLGMHSLTPSSLSMWDKSTSHLNHSSSSSSRGNSSSSSRDSDSRRSSSAASSSAVMGRLLERSLPLPSGRKLDSAAWLCSAQHAQQQRMLGEEAEGAEGRRGGSSTLHNGGLIHKSVPVEGGGVASAPSRVTSSSNRKARQQGAQGDGEGWLKERGMSAAQRRTCGKAATELAGRLQALGLGVCLRGSANSSSAAYMNTVSSSGLEQRMDHRASTVSSTTSLGVITPVDTAPAAGAAQMVEAVAQRLASAQASGRAVSGRARIAGVVRGMGWCVALASPSLLLQRELVGAIGGACLSPSVRSAHLRSTGLSLVLKTMSPAAASSNSRGSSRSTCSSQGSSSTREELHHWGGNREESDEAQLRETLAEVLRSTAYSTALRSIAHLQQVLLDAAAAAPPTSSATAASRTHPAVTEPQPQAAHRLQSQSSKQSVVVELGLDITPAPPPLPLPSPPSPAQALLDRTLALQLLSVPWARLQHGARVVAEHVVPGLSHSQLQTLLAAHPELLLPDGHAPSQQAPLAPASQARDASRGRHAVRGGEGLASDADSNSDNSSSSKRQHTARGALLQCRRELEAAAGCSAAQASPLVARYAGLLLPGSPIACQDTLPSSLPLAASPPATLPAELMQPPQAQPTQAPHLTEAPQAAALGQPLHPSPATPAHADPPIIPPTQAAVAPTPAQEHQRSQLATHTSVLDLPGTSPALPASAAARPRPSSLRFLLHAPLQLLCAAPLELPALHALHVLLHAAEQLHQQPQQTSHAFLQPLSSAYKQSSGSSTAGLSHGPGSSLHHQEQGSKLAHPQPQRAHHPDAFKWPQIQTQFGSLARVDSSAAPGLAPASRPLSTSSSPYNAHQHSPITTPLEVLLLALQPGTQAWADVQQLLQVLGSQGCELWASELRVCRTAGASETAAQGLACILIHSSRWPRLHQLQASGLANSMSYRVALEAPASAFGAAYTSAPASTLNSSLPSASAPSQAADAQPSHSHQSASDQLSHQHQQHQNQQQQHYAAPTQPSSMRMQQLAQSLGGSDAPARQQQNAGLPADAAEQPQTQEQEQSGASSSSSRRGRGYMQPSSRSQSVRATFPSSTTPFPPQASATPSPTLASPRTVPAAPWPDAMLAATPSTAMPSGQVRDLPKSRSAEAGNPTGLQRVRSSAEVQQRPPLPPPPQRQQQQQSATPPRQQWQQQWRQRAVMAAPRVRLHVGRSAALHGKKKQQKQQQQQQQLDQQRVQHQRQLPGLKQVRLDPAVSAELSKHFSDEHNANGGQQMQKESRGHDVLTLSGVGPGNFLDEW